MSKLGNLTAKAKSSIKTTGKVKSNTMTSHRKSLSKTSIYNPYAVPYSQYFLYNGAYPYIFQNPYLAAAIPAKPKRSKSKAKSSYKASSISTTKKDSISSTVSTSIAKSTSNPSTTKTVTSPVTSSTSTTKSSTTGSTKVTSTPSSTPSTIPSTTPSATSSSYSTNSYGLDKQQLGRRIRSHTEKDENTILDKLTHSPKQSSIYDNDYTKSSSSYSTSSSSTKINSTYTSSTSSNTYDKNNNSLNNYKSSNYTSNNSNNGSSSSSTTYINSNSQSKSIPSYSSSNSQSYYSKSNSTFEIPAPDYKSNKSNEATTSSSYNIPKNVSGPKPNYMENSDANPKPLPTPPTTPLTKWMPNPSASNNESSQYPSSSYSKNISNNNISQKKSSPLSMNQPLTYPSSTTSMPSSTIPDAKSYVNKYISTSFTSTKVQDNNDNYKSNYPLGNDNKKRKYSEPTEDAFGSMMTNSLIENSIMEKIPSPVSSNKKVDTKSYSYSYSDSYNTNTKDMNLAKDEKDMTYNKSYSYPTSSSSSLLANNNNNNSSSLNNSISMAQNNKALYNAKTKAKPAKYKRPKTYTTNIQLLERLKEKDQEKELYAKHASRMNASLMNSLGKNKASIKNENKDFEDIDKKSVYSSTKSSPIKMTSPLPIYYSPKSTSPSITTTSTPIPSTTTTPTKNNISKPVSNHPTVNTSTPYYNSPRSYSFDTSSFVKKEYPTDYSAKPNHDSSIPSISNGPQSSQFMPPQNSTPMTSYTSKSNTPISTPTTNAGYTSSYYNSTSPQNNNNNYQNMNNDIVDRPAPLNNYNYPSKYMEPNRIPQQPQPQPQPQQQSQQQPQSYNMNNLSPSMSQSSSFEKVKKPVMSTPSTVSGMNSIPSYDNYQPNTFSNQPMARMPPMGPKKDEKNGMDMQDAAEILLQMHLCV